MSVRDTQSHILKSIIELTIFLLLFSHPPKGVRPCCFDEHLPSSKAVSRPSVGGAKKPGAPSGSAASRGGGGAGAKVIDS